MTPLPIIVAHDDDASALLAFEPAVAARWLVAFLRDELIERRGITRAVVGLSGGVDSAVTAALCARALGAANVFAFRLPYRASSAQSLSDADLMARTLGIVCETLDISAPVDAYLTLAADADARRRGNVMARMRMIALFDQAARLGALPIGTGNKTERLLGYYTWHADDAPPLNPLGDLLKTHVWALARELAIPESIVAKAPTADLEADQTDEGDLGVSYHLADRILALILAGYRNEEIVARGVAPEALARIRARLDGTHWKRHLPTTALLSASAINEFYLRPVDY